MVVGGEGRNDAPEDGPLRDPSLEDDPRVVSTITTAGVVEEERLRVFEEVHQEQVCSLNSARLLLTVGWVAGRESWLALLCFSARGGHSTRGTNCCVWISTRTGLVAGFAVHVHYLCCSSVYIPESILLCARKVFFRATLHFFLLVLLFFSEACLPLGPTWTKWCTW